MMNDLFFGAQFLLFISCAVFAYASGGVAERQGVIWVAANFVISTGFFVAGWNSPTAHLVLDGIYAVGLLPFAIIYVSWWLGAMTLLAAGAFSLEAAYLIQDLSFDRLYCIVNNAINLAAAPVMFACGVSNLLHRRKRPLDNPPVGGSKLQAA